MPFDLKKYPKNWTTEIRPAILSRASHRCERCGVPNHAVGRRNDGEWEPLRGNRDCDLAGRGLLSFRKARDIAEVLSEGEETKFIVIVLTIAHLRDPDPMNCSPENLAALCQRCRNRLDAPMRAANAKRTREARLGPELPWVAPDAMPCR